MFDENKIFGQEESDGSFGGGDSLSWTGSLAMLGGTDLNIYKTFSKGFGGLVRHPSEGYSSYYKSPWDGRISRDQLKGALAGMIAQGDRRGVLKVWLHGLAWGGMFAYNTRHNGELSSWKWPDILGPEVLAMFIRGILGKFALVLYPILLLCDLWLMASGIVLKKNNDSHVISYLACLITARENCPTIALKLVEKITPTPWLLASLITYWCGWRGNCFIIDLYENKLKES